MYEVTLQQVNSLRIFCCSSGGHATDWLSIPFTSPEPYEGMGSFWLKKKTGLSKLKRLAAGGKNL